MIRSFIFSVILFGSMLACSPDYPKDKLTFDYQLITYHKKWNSNILARTSHLVSENGERKADVKLLEKMQELLGLRDQFNLDFSRAERMVDRGFPGYLEEELSSDWMGFVSKIGRKDTLTRFTEAFVHLYQEAIHEGSRTFGREGELLRSAVLVYTEKPDLVNCLNFELTLTGMETAILDHFYQSIGAGDTRDFAGYAYLYLEQDSVKVNEPFRFFASIESYYVNHSITISNPTVLLNNTQLTHVQVTPFGTNAWEVTLSIPDTGTYELWFSVKIDFNQYDNEYPFYCYGNQLVRVLE